jgi:hypothetical protein
MDNPIIHQRKGKEPTMNRKSLLAAVSGLSALALAATCGPALAFGPHGHGHSGDDMQYGLLAHAAGITSAQIEAAFEAAGPTLHADGQTLRADKAAVDSCIIAGGTAGCSTQIAAYTAAKSALTQEQLSIWQGLFAKAPNANAAVSLKSNLDNLNTQKHNLIKQVFSSAKDSDSTSSQTSPE